MKEQRKNKRINIYIEVDYSCNKTTPGSKANCKDISEKGINLLTNNHLPFGSILHMKFVIPDNCFIIQISGIVKWNDFDLRENLYTNGIKFCDIKKEQQEIIKKFIDKTTFDLRG